MALAYGSCNEYAAKEACPLENIPCSGDINAVM